MNKILVVDDSRDLLDFFPQILKINGYDVTVASCKKEMEAQLKYYMPDLIFMDVFLNNENGKEICQDTKRKYQHIAIILMSGSTEFLKDYLEYGADGIMEKPFDLRTMNQIIKKALHENINIQKPIDKM